MNYRLLLLVGMAFMLGACGQDDEAGSQQDTMDAAPATDAAGETERATGLKPGEDYKLNVIDHSQDIKEFEVRRSIAGVESLIEHYKENGWNTRELEKELKDLRKKLDKVTG